jgi:thiol-disulfide isomerase/thioredoxin
MRPLAALVLGFASLAIAGTPVVPRQAPEFVVTMPGGRQALLSQFKGKVVALEFLFTTCPHCQHEASLIAPLNTELGPKGFQPVGVAINTMDIPTVMSFVQQTGANFPIGVSERNAALDFMGISIMERWVVPQLVLVDRKGMVRYQTPPLGAEEVLNPTWLREKIEELLKEPAASTHHPAAAKKAAVATARKPGS